MSTEATFWKRCATCKREIPFVTTYWVCNVVDVQSAAHRSGVLQSRLLGCARPDAAAS